MYSFFLDTVVGWGKGDDSMENVSRTLYIPLYGKALVSRRGLILRDPDAEAIWEKADFPLRGKSASKWLAYTMGMRSAVFDRWLEEKMNEHPHRVILHLGCGIALYTLVYCGGMWLLGLNDYEKDLARKPIRKLLKLAGNIF